MSLVVAWSSILREVKVAGIISSGSAGRIKFVLCTFSSLAELMILNAVMRMRANLYSFRVFAVNSLLEKTPPNSCLPVGPWIEHKQLHL